MATWQDIITAAQTLLQRWKRDVDFTSQIVNGPATGPTSVVNTDGGTIPTFAKTMADITGAGNSLKSDLANATDPAKGAALVARAVARVNAIIGAPTSGLRDGDVIFAKGRSVADDGGGDIFTYWETSTATVDNGLVFTSGVGRFVREGWTIFGFTGDEVKSAWFGAKNANTDDTAAIQGAINTGKAVYLGSGTSQISSTLVPFGSNKLILRGAGANHYTLQAATGFTGYMISPTGSYDVSGINGNGIAGADGIYFIGNNTPGAGGARARLYDLRLFNFDQAINFGPEYEHPLGVDYDRVYVQAFRTAGINLGGRTGVASSGESAFDFGGSVIVTNANVNGIAYSQSVTVNTPDATHDTITWTDPGTTPEFGYMVMRSADGVTGWHCPPNWSEIYHGTLSFVASKTSGETWTYAVVRQTVGVNIRRAKTISGGAVQAEYVGIGILGDNVKALEFNSTYYENRDTVPPRPAFAGVAFNNSFPVKIGTVWVEQCGYGVFFGSNSRGAVGGGQASNCAWAAIGNTGSTDQVVGYDNILISGTTPAVYRSPTGNANDYSYVGREYATGEMTVAVSHTTKVTHDLRFRGTSKSKWSYDATNGATITLNSASITPMAKAGMALGNQANASLVTTLTNAVATAILSFTMPSNSGATLAFAFTVVVLDGSNVYRQTAGGTLIVTADSAAGTVAAGVNSLVAQALQAGSMTGPTFTTSVSGSVVTVLCNVDSSQAGSVRITLVPIAASGSQVPTAITQA